MNVPEGQEVYFIVSPHTDKGGIYKGTIKSIAVKNVRLEKVERVLPTPGKGKDGYRPKIDCYKKLENAAKRAQEEIKQAANQARKKHKENLRRLREQFKRYQVESNSKE